MFLAVIFCYYIFCNTILLLISKWPKETETLRRWAQIKVKEPCWALPITAWNSYGAILYVPLNQLDAVLSGYLSPRPIPWMKGPAFKTEKAIVNLNSRHIFTAFIAAISELLKLCVNDNFHVVDYSCGCYLWLNLATSTGKLFETHDN